MKILSIEAADMGNNQQEIAEEALYIIGDRDFKSPEEFYNLESKLILQSCMNLGWNSFPSTGGLIVNWDSPTGEFE